MAATQVIVVTEDQELLAAVARSQPADAGWQHCGPHAAPALLAAHPEAQWWIDLDCLPTPPAGRCAGRIYFYGGRPPGSRPRPPGTMLRKPCADTTLALLWAQVAGPRGDAAPPTPKTPLSWVAELVDLDLDGVCQRCANELPALLGYQVGALYLYQRRQRMLKLAETNARQPLALAVALDEQTLHDLTDESRGCLRTDDRGRSLVGQVGLIGGDGAALVLTEQQQLEAVLLLGTRLVDQPPRPEPALVRIAARALRNARLYKQARIEARVDRLTGLYNDRWMEEALEHEVRRCQRYGSALSLMMIDLDGLKQVNDRWGHSAGDAMIRHVAGRIVAALRQIDSAARVGGDEFVVLLPSTALDGARQVAERIARILRTDAPTIAGRIVPASASIGVVQWAANRSPAELRAAADRAMYRAKRRGGDRVCWTRLRAAAAPERRKPVRL